MSKLNMDSIFSLPLESGYLTVNSHWNSYFKNKFEFFLCSFKKSSSEQQEKNLMSYYQKVVLDTVHHGMRTIVIDWNDIFQWDEGTSLAMFIQKFFLVLWKSLDYCIDKFVKNTLRYYFEKKYDESGGSQHITSEYIQKNATEETTISHDIAMCDKMTFHVSFISKMTPITIRDISCNTIGQLINIKGTVTRLSDVRPELCYATFECSQCHKILENIEQQFKYTEPTICSNTSCKNRISWILRHDASIYKDWQKMRFQENSSEIPAGSIPRIIEVILSRNLCDKCKPGDKLVLTGCLSSIPDVPSLMKPGELPKSIALDRNRLSKQNDQDILKNGIRNLGYKLVIFATDIRKLNNGLHTFDESEKLNIGNAFTSKSVYQIMDYFNITLENKKLFLDIAESNDTLYQLSLGIAPEVFGSENIKKGILTMLVGGVEKNTKKDKLKLRGDINLCIVGDPGTAKSQLLKFVHQFIGRAVYTSGNTSTAAGLTVSIHKDTDQGDSVIEAGALMLADKGICCIDEFDKMNSKDVVAMHEAMEQQTISICKSGIQATLNARASILAACNPRNGRYDCSKSFRHNVKLSSAIISRFDLFFTMIDSTERDGLVARHIVDLHMKPSQTILDKSGILEKSLLKTYLAIARILKPRITEESRKHLVETYVAMREENSQVYSRGTPRVTVRQLESLVRLSEAIAKLKFSDVVLPCHVYEARCLIYNSFSKLAKVTIDLTEDNQKDSNLFLNTPYTDDIQQSSHTVGQTIDVEEFEKIASAFIDRLRSLEVFMFNQKCLNNCNDKIQPFIEAVVAKDDLISWYIDNCTDSSISESEASLEKEFQKLNNVLNRMIHRDFTLIEEERDMELPCENNEITIKKLTAVRLHPNLSMDNIKYTAKTHFTELHEHDMNLTESMCHTNEESSWNVNDENFINYMYGWNDD